MQNIKELSAMEMKAAIQNFEAIKQHKEKNRNRTYRKYTEKRGRKRKAENQKSLGQMSGYQKKKDLKDKELLSFQDIVNYYQDSLKCGYMKMYKDVKNTTYCLDYLYTKGWIVFEHKKKRGVLQTYVSVKREYVEQFMFFYRNYLR